MLTTADRLILPNHLRRLHPDVFRITHELPLSPLISCTNSRFPSSDAEQTDRKLKERKSCCAEGQRGSRPIVIPAACKEGESVQGGRSTLAACRGHCRGRVCPEAVQAKPGQTRPSQAGPSRGLIWPSATAVCTDSSSRMRGVSLPHPPAGASC